MESSVEALVSLDFIAESLIGSLDVLHFFLQHSLHLLHLIRQLASRLIRVVVKHLKSLCKRIDLGSHFISQVTDLCDVPKDLSLLQPEVLVEALDVSQGVLHILFNDNHALSKSLVLLLDGLDSLLKKASRGSDSIHVI